MKLDKQVQKYVQNQTLKSGMASELLRIDSKAGQTILAKQAQIWDWSLSETRKIVREILTGYKTYCWQRAVTIDWLYIPDFIYSEKERLSKYEKIHDGIDVYFDGVILRGFKAFETAKQVKSEAVNVRIHSCIAILN